MVEADTSAGPTGARVAARPDGSSAPAPERACVPRVRYALALGGALLPLALGHAFDTGVDRLAGVSALALAAIPATFLASLPRRVGGTASARDELGLVLALAPPFTAAAALDVAQGADRAGTLALLFVALLVVLALGDAARRAAARAQSARVHAAAWAALVVAPPLLEFALERGGGPFLGRAPGWVRALAESSPLGTLVERLALDAPRAWTPLAPAALAVVAVVAFAARGIRRLP